MTDVRGDWSGDNQDWWDWYVSLAENDRSAAPLVDLGPLPDVAWPDDAELALELAEPFELGADAVDAFRVNGFVKLPGVLSPGATLRLRAELKRLLEATCSVSLDGGVKDCFLSLEMVWLDNPLVRRFVFSPRIAKICADLLGVDRVRLYHDNVLSKEPGCGRTPWHHDDHHFPLDTHDVVTTWIAAQAIPIAMGPLAFAGPIDTHRLVAGVPFNKTDTSYDRHVGQLFRQHEVAVDESPFALGEASFHHNLNFHTAGPNRTTRSRIVLANTFFADGARIVADPTIVSGDWRKFMPGCEPGGLAESDLNPVCWPAERSA
ncbi:phytanoyl-CoA dioxygenase family protein [Sphingomonas bacterium]|uniref:phytanoyl-CoA dioxygenase family protein n=1 Tax=Sphingomonas bacterium TaxID=1895847 RepID=UPI0020C73951|nr:phytanoyl-CoA dioxygenase family protein [Sphingomonas bacterium]